MCLVGAGIVARRPRCGTLRLRGRKRRPRGGPAPYVCSRGWIWERTRRAMEDNQKKQEKPKGLSLKVKTLEKKSAPMRCAGTPVIGYS